MATVILIVIIIACIGIIVHRQMELDNCLSSHTKCRNKIEALVEQKGANEEKRDHALTLKEQADLFLKRTFASEDRLIQDAKECQTLVRQLVQNVTALAGEKDSLVREFNLCNEKLTACEATKTS